jgi:DNA helicase-2/ATP-dependent DNA helicase PcrA
MWRDEEADDIPSTAGSGKFRRGSRVFHAKFGTGTITHVDGDRLEIHFDHAGHKRVIASFIRSA